MELDRPHFRTTSTGSSTAASSELFICFTSRLSSSSMKLSKSILSPGRAARDGGASLSSSLSRRLRNGSLKGGASPFFATTTRKRGCAFENPEPSSPKVTCIGQVRVKTKKKVKQSRSLSKRRSGEVSFRKVEQGGGDGGEIGYHQQQQPQPPPECLPHRNHRWVHLPVSICEALRAFGAEFSCLFPCKSSCFSNSERDDQKGEKHESGCGAVFARWLVSVNDGEGGNRREIELVVGGGDEEEVAAERISMRSSRRHVFEDIEVKDDRIEVKGRRLEGEEEAARVSICIPPKNALLLMRCRSDPMKMAALAATTKNDDEYIEEEIEVEDVVVCEEQVVQEEEVCGGKDEVIEQDFEEQETSNEEEAELEEQVREFFHGEEIQEEELIIGTEEMVEENAEELQPQIIAKEEAFEEEEAEVESNMSSFEALLVQENTESYEDCPIQDKEEEENNRIRHLSPSTESDEGDIESNVETPPVLEEGAAMENEKEADEEEPNTMVANNGEENQPKPELHEHGENEEEGERAIRATEQEEENRDRSEEMVTANEELKKEKESKKVLPDCLLLMMCEPKLSMEVSKETWVCSTDFIRWLPERPRKPAKVAKADHEPVKRRLSVDSKPKAFSHALPTEQQQLLPPRLSCSLPAAAAAASMATMIEQKLVNAVAYEPFVLTRCKSEPMRTAAAKLMPESCFWKNAMRKLEPHRRGVGAAGVGC